MYIDIMSITLYIFQFDESTQFNSTIQFDDSSTLRDGGAAIERRNLSQRLQIGRHLHAAIATCPDRATLAIESSS